MASDVVLRNLDPRDFMGIIPERRAKIEAASAAPPPADYPVNRLMRAFHPEAQYLKITAVESHGPDAKSYILAPDKARGTDELAYFSAGQYLSISLEIGGSKLAKPYSIRSAPASALAGSYIVTVKRAEDGFAADYILDTWKVGDSVVTSGPEGNFTYEPLRDPKHILGLAGGSGITPFYSLASAIADGTEDFELTLLYGSRTADDILLKAEFDALEKKCPKLKIVHVLSEKPEEGYESGFITAELIKKYAPNGDYSLFICGPQVMYDFVDKEVAKLDLPQRRVRHELFGQMKHPEKLEGYPKGVGNGPFKMTVVIRDDKRVVDCRADETLLVALERAGIAAPNRCRSGECGFCHSRLASGNVYIPPNLDKRRGADLKFGYVHPCCSFPCGDVEINVKVK